MLPKGVTADIRGLGLMIGIEFLNAPAGSASKVASEAFKLDTLVLTTSIYETLRLIPALNISKEDTDIAIEKVLASIEAAFKA